MTINWKKRTKPPLPVVTTLLKSDEHYVDSLRTPVLGADGLGFIDPETGDFSGVDRTVAPRIFKDDPDTGIYRPSDPGMKVSTGSPGDIVLDTERKVVMVKGEFPTTGEFLKSLKDSWLADEP
jgi:hypothetical protein